MHDIAAAIFFIVVASLPLLSAAVAFGWSDIRMRCDVPLSLYWDIMAAIQRIERDATKRKKK